MNYKEEVLKQFPNAKIHSQSTPIDINNWLVDVRELTEEQFQDIQDFRFLGNNGTKDNYINTGELFIGVIKSKVVCLKQADIAIRSYETVKELFNINDY